jgi:hypothetical protein
VAVEVAVYPIQMKGQRLRDETAHQNIRSRPARPGVPSSSEEESALPKYANQAEAQPASGSSEGAAVVLSHRPNRCRWCGVLSAIYKHCEGCAPLSHIKDVRVALNVAEDGEFGRKWWSMYVQGKVRPEWRGEK